MEEDGSLITRASPKPKVAISKYQCMDYFLGLAKQASGFDTTTEFLINYIKKWYDYGNDIGTAPENLESVLNVAPWKLQTQVSIEEDEAICTANNRQFEIEFKADYNTFSKQVQTRTIKQRYMPCYGRDEPRQ